MYITEARIYETNGAKFLPGNRNAAAREKLDKLREKHVWYAALKIRPFLSRKIHDGGIQFIKREFKM